MTKRVNVLLLFVVSVACVWLTVFLYQTDADYRSRGLSAQIHEGVQFEQLKQGLLAHMTYTNQRSETVLFKRFASPDAVGRMRAKQPVFVEFIPGEWNSERFQGEDSGAWKWALASVVLVTALVWTIRRPSHNADHVVEHERRLSPLGWLLVWLIRGGVFMLAAGGLMAGVAGLLGGHAGTQDIVFLIVGVVFAAVFAASLKMRLA